MSHGGPGYYYYRYGYQCPWRDSHGNTGVDNTYHSAVYSATDKQSHSGQTDWFKNKAMPAVRRDILRNYDVYNRPNKKGITYEPYNERYVRQFEFRYCSKLPVHQDGPRKGLPFGKEV